MYTTIADEPNMIVLGHGNIGSAFATQFRTVCGRNVVAIVGRSGGSIVIPNDAILSQFAQQSNDQKRESLDATITLDGLVEDFGGKDRVVIIDASSNSDPNAHTELFEKGFRIISANKNPLGLGDISTAQQMLSSNTYGGEATVMAGQGALRFVGDERLNQGYKGPIESIQRIDLIGSGTLSGIAGELASGVEYSVAVKNAIKRGDTEPNPNDDMDGMDLAKKLVIIARKAGYSVSIDNVRFGNGFLDESFRTEFEGQDWGDKNRETETQKNFIEKIALRKDAEMRDIIENRKPLVPRYVGRMVRNITGGVDLSVSIEFVSADSEHCAAKYNKIIMTVERGPEAPTDTKTLSGRGAGPVQTAQGLIRDFNGIMRSKNT